jgi:hypothetical protein
MPLESSRIVARACSGRARACLGHGNARLARTYKNVAPALDTFFRA